MGPDFAVRILKQAAKKGRPSSSPFAVTRAFGLHRAEDKNEFSLNSHHPLHFDGTPSEPLEWGSISERHEFLRTPRVLSRLISRCAQCVCIDAGVQLHSVVVKMGFTSNVYLRSALVDLYGKCGRISHAHDLFNELGERSAVTWNSLISGYLHVGLPMVAMDLFRKMLGEGIVPTPHSGSNVLVACAQLKDGDIGRQMHALGSKAGFGWNVVFGTGLIDMYGKCTNLEDSRRVFDRMACKNDITWTAMITGHAQNEQPSEAMILLREMMRQDIRPNYVAYNSLMCSFSNPDYLNWCKQVHCRVIVEGLESNVYIAVTLVTVYSECNSSLEDFHKVGLGIRIWDQISWNAVIAGHANLDDGKGAVNCFCKMRKAGICTGFFTFASTLKAVGSLSALEEGKQIHALVFKSGHASNMYVQNGLVSMYARCGILADAKKVFSSMEECDVISWNALLSGYAHHGFGREAVELFEQMRLTDIEPDSTTFLAVLTACSYVGLVEKGLEYFSIMRCSDSLEPPKLEHYATIVNLFGRAGYLEEAEAFINGMPVKPGPSVYKALLSSCRIHGNKEIALRSAKELLELCPDDPATYVLLSNVLLTGCEWIDAAEIRALMCDRRVQKKPGSSWLYL